MNISPFSHKFRSGYPLYLGRAGKKRALPEMKRILLFLLFLFISGPGPLSAVWAADEPPSEGEFLHAIVLPVPKDAPSREYLGIPPGKKFKTTDIKSGILVIEIFSMYCPYCQREAPAVNRLYRRIEEDPALKGKIKVIGIGVGNSAFEVAIFRKKYHIPFPLFPDPEFFIHARMARVRTPYFLAMTVNPRSSHQVVHSQLGGLNGIDRFLERIMGRPGTNREKK